MIKRERILNEIRPFYDNDIIKVLIGIRRCGKSTVLNQIVQELNINKDHIIYINFEDYSFSHIDSADKLHNYVKMQIRDNEKYYLFFDEIQNIEDWEKVVNSFKATLNSSIFITGSNSNLLSGELATHLSGRYVSFKITPFTFKEYLTFFNEKDEIKSRFTDYVMWGAMPQSLQFEKFDEKSIYLSDLFDSIILKDIVQRYNIKEVELFYRIVEYIVTNPSQTFSAKALAKYLESVNRKVSNETIYNYIEYMSSSLIINKVQPYDIRGKRLLTRNDKYYLTDLGLGQIKNQDKRPQIGVYLENVIYNELIASGYNVSIGKINGKEIDFIATKSQKKIYIQVCYLLADDATIKREFDAFKDITDNHEKYVVSMDDYDLSDNGIIHMNILDFILNILN